MRIIWVYVLSAAFLACASCTGQPTHSAAVPLPRGAHYVAMGSSFAAGPGISTVVLGSPARCARSEDNYAHLLARRRGLDLTDASCSGATTAHILGPWNELPAQLDAVRADTRLVTVTIGGNDLGYIGGLIGASCPPLGLTMQLPCHAMVAPSAADYARLMENMHAIATEVHRRAPVARLVFVDYVTVLPPTGSCAAAPLSDADSAIARAIAERLRGLTAAVAQQNRGDLLSASDLTRTHHACAAESWINGFSRPDPAAPRVPYHPTLASMTAVADALDRLLRR